MVLRSTPRPQEFRKVRQMRFKVGGRVVVDRGAARGQHRGGRRTHAVGRDREVVDQVLAVPPIL